MNDLKLNDIEIKISEEMVDDIFSQAENNAAASDNEDDEYTVITVNDYDVW